MKCWMISEESKCNIVIKAWFQAQRVSTLVIPCVNCGYILIKKRSLQRISKGNLLPARFWEHKWEYRKLCEITLDFQWFGLYLKQFFERWWICMKQDFRRAHAPDDWISFRSVPKIVLNTPPSRNLWQWPLFADIFNFSFFLFFRTRPLVWASSANKQQRNSNQRRSKSWRWRSSEMIWG